MKIYKKGLNSCCKQKTSLTNSLCFFCRKLMVVSSICTGHGLSSIVTLNILWNHFYSFYKHVHMDYNPLKGTLVLISSLKLSIVPNAAGPESWGHSRTVFANISMSNCFPSFIVHWILNFVDQPTHENHENWYPTNKSDFPVSGVPIIGNID
jgi:hypothetical protein